MAFIDLVILVTIGGFVLLGFFFGFVKMIGSLLGTVLALIIANQFTEPLFHSFGYILGGGSIARLIFFVLLFFVVSKGIGIIFWLLGKVLKVVSMIPFAKTTDRLLGIVIGLVEGVLVVSVVYFYATRVVQKETLDALTQGSVLAKNLALFVGVIQMYLPASVKQVIDVTTKVKP